MATENDMIVSRKKRKVKRKARVQRKKATILSKRAKKKSRKKPQSKRKPIASNGVKGSSKRAKKRPSRAQLEKQLQQAQQKIRKLSKPANRSAAAKKGWETRRRRIAERAAVSLQEAETITGVVFSQIDKERLEFFQQPEVRRQIRDLFIEKLPDFFVQGEQWIEQPEPSMIRRLIYAEVEGTFDETAHEIAEETGYEPNEIYSLWWGYKLE